MRASVGRVRYAGMIFLFFSIMSLMFLHLEIGPHGVREKHPPRGFRP